VGIAIRLSRPAIQRGARGLAEFQADLRDKILERGGRLKERYPKARGFAQIIVTATKQPRLEWTWDQAKYRQTLATDGDHLLRSNQPGWTAAESWETNIQLTIVERAFPVLKSELF